MLPIENVSRRSVLQSLAVGGALILSGRLMGPR
jgi:hypothetical protein